MIARLRGVGARITGIGLLVCASSGWLAVSAAAETSTADLKPVVWGVSGPTPVGYSSTFAITVLGVGGTAVEDVSVVVTLPTQLAFTSASVDSPNPLTTCASTATAGQTACDLGTITAGPDHGPTFYLNFTVRPNAIAGTVVALTATVHGSESDPNPANDTAVMHTRIRNTALLKAHVSSTVVPRGGSSWVTVAVTNIGPNVAHGLDITMYLHPIRIITFTDHQSPHFSGGSLAPGRTLTYRIHVSGTAGQATAHATLDVIPASSAFDPNCSIVCAQSFALTARPVAAAQPVAYVEAGAPMGPGCGSGLAHTGGPIAGLLLLAIMLLALGGVLVGLGKPRPTEITIGDSGCSTP